MLIVKNKALKSFLYILGWISFGLGFIGAFLPVIPTAPFMILAAWCFLKSSPKAHDWLHRQPMIGDQLRLWEERGAIAVKSKIFAIVTILISLGLIAFQDVSVVLKVSLGAIMLGVCVFVGTRPSQ